MNPFGLQLFSVTFLAALSSGVALAMPDVPPPDAGEVPKPAWYAAYQEVPGAAGSHERLLDRGQFESMTEVVDSLLRLMPALTQYHKPASQPRVFRVTRAQIEKEMCGGRACTMRAWYLPDEGIYLEDNLHPETDLFDRSVLFHELVHYLQELNPEDAALDMCNRWFQREIQAYGLQNQYLALSGNAARVTHPGYPCRDWNQASPTGRGVREDGSQALEQ